MTTVGERAARSWDAQSYDRVGGPMTAMAIAVLARLPLAGDETVLDAGCGTGRVTQILVDRLPRGRVIAVDADPAMVALASANLGRRAEVLEADLLELQLAEPVDAIFSTATLHWILDHPRLFERLAANLRPGGRLVAQCGGRGNVSALKGIADQLAAGPRLRGFFDGWQPPWYYPGPEETATLLTALGFTGVRTWLEPWPVVPDQPEEYLATVPLGPYVQQLPEHLRSDFVDAVIDRLGRPVAVDYVRLNIDATKPA
ncbi:MAG TPA: methyltransferase domain-containing protein [Acidimicrobiales bacterium]